MKIGLIGAGNMAQAIARGWGQPVLCTDSGSGRAARLVAELGGQAFASNAELAAAADAVLLCHKPYQLDAVAAEIRDRTRVVISVLGGTPTTELQRAYPDAQVFALMPNTPVEVRRGVTVYADPGPDVAVDADLREQVLGEFRRLGEVVTVAERLLDAATSVTGVGPAYTALLVEAQVDAAVRQGIPAPLAARLVVATLGGTASLLAAHDYDTLAVRRAVTSPGGSTARGLRELERAGVRTAFHDAADAVAGLRVTR